MSALLSKFLLRSTLERLGSMTAPLGPIVDDPIAESYARIEILVKLRATVQRLGISDQEAHLVTFEC